MNSNFQRERYTGMFPHDGSKARGIAVLRSVGYTERGAFVVNELISSKRVLDHRHGRIVGYEIRNVSLGETFEIPVRVWSRDKTDSRRIFNSAVRVLKPNDAILIEKGDLFVWLLQNPGLGWKLHNGQMKESCLRHKATDDIYEIASAFSFSFDPKSGMRVHDPATKFNCGERDETGIWRVKPEYYPVFGIAERERIRKRSQGSVPLEILNKYRMEAERSESASEGKHNG